MAYRILSIDGGGIYGSFFCTVLERLEQEYPKLVEESNLIAGTSIGGITALALAHGVTPVMMKQLFVDHAKEIFKQSIWRKIASYFGITCRYSNTNLERVLKAYFGDTTLGELKKKVIISTFQVDCDSENRCWKAKFFHNFEGPDSDKHEKVVKVAMATAAAPVIFPICDRYIDGGVVDSNPSMAALAQTQDSRLTCKRPKLEEIRMLSIGRIQRKHYIVGRDLHWGYFRWIKPIVYMILDRDSDVVHYQCDKILGQNYHRLCPPLPVEIQYDIDNWGGIPDLIKYGETLNLDTTIQWLKSEWSTNW